MSYHVGQIIFLRVSKSTKILPAQICEEVVTRTLTGQKVSYFCKLPGHEESFDISELDAAIYTDPEQLRSELIHNASEGINKIINNAKLLAQKQFSTGPEVITSDLVEAHQYTSNTLDEELIRVDLGNGQVGILRHG
jgi:hypothetical protein